MKLGLVGLPSAGKTTLFNALTGMNRPTTGAVPGKLDIQVAVVDVPDPRLETLNEMFDPRKKVPAKITYADIGGVAKGISEGGLGGQFRQEISQMDGLLVVVRAFLNPGVPHPDEGINPHADLETLDSEFLFSDLALVEARIDRLSEEMSRGKNRDENARELVLLERIKTTLEDETPLRGLEFAEEELKKIRGFGFLTMKPRLVLVNTGEENAPFNDLLALREKGEKVISIQGSLEMEISQLDAEEAAIFQAEYGISEPARDRVIRESYGILRVQTFFTVGEDEVRAWPHRVGAAAREAAGEIHSDLERGFIRAEIIHCDTLIELGGLSEARSVGKLRVEGKTYIMQDGDVMNVLFNV
jgi:hypothetical protein